VPKPRRTRHVTAAQVRAYAGKATEYLDAARSELDDERYIAATSLAIHAAINAADVVCGARLGMRAAGADHDEVVALLGASSLGGGGRI
jgi:predicted S18 family serine protease